MLIAFTLILVVVTSVLGTAKDYPALSYIDPSISPCQDFYQFACGNFHKVHEIPENDSFVNNFSLLEDELIAIGKDILSSNNVEDDPIALQKAKAAYKSCLDTNLTDAIYKNFIPELLIVDEWGGFPLISSENVAKFSWNDIGRMVAHFGIPLLFNFVVYPRLDNADDYMVVMSNDPLANPSMIRPEFEKNYDNILEHDFVNIKKRSVDSKATKAPFDIFLMEFSKLVVHARNPNKTEEEIQSDLDDMANFMRQLAKSGIVTGNVINFKSQYPTLRELQDWTYENFGNDMEINWVEYFDNIFNIAGVNITEDLIIYPQSASLIYNVLNLVRQTDPNIVKNFALLRIFLYLAPDSVAPIRKIFEDYYRAKNYPLYSRSDYCTRKILDATDTASVSFAVAYAYQRYHFDANKLVKAAQLVQLIEESFVEVLGEADWMDKESKQAAFIKVHNMVTLMGYPNFVEEREKLDRFYRNVRICGWDNYSNAQKLRSFKQAYLFSQLARPRTRTFWDKSTFDTNAYYNRANNKIVLPIAMLNSPYMDGYILDDLGRLGSIIGHEITHGFDVSGQKYNQDGVQIAWWSEETQKRFQNKTQCFINQYDNYCDEEVSACVDGTLTLNENLADNGGLRTAYRAFNNLEINSKNHRNMDFTPDQRFFMAYASTWCSSETFAYMQKYFKNEHAPYRYRVNGPVSNMVEFAEAFNCPLGSPMNPIEKCILW